MPLLRDVLSLLILPSALAMADPYYCSERSGYINPGMSEADVISACGQPLSKEKSNQPATERIPVTQLIYTALDTGSVYPGLNAAFYTQWSIPSGTSGIVLQVNVIDNKIASVTINGSSTEAMSLCGGSIQIHDDVSNVYNACGTPARVNTTYINQIIPSRTKPEIWTYRATPYQPAAHLTFVNGQLQSID